MSTLDSFDADVLIYAAVADHPLGRGVRSHFEQYERQGGGRSAGIGSVLLLPELFSKPVRQGADHEVAALAALVGRLDLLPVNPSVARLAVALGAWYGLRAADAVHLATAVSIGADRFITNNRSDFTKAITEIDIVYPDELPER